MAHETSRVWNLTVFRCRASATSKTGPLLLRQMVRPRQVPGFYIGAFLRWGVLKTHICTTRWNVQFSREPTGSFTARQSCQVPFRNDGGFVTEWTASSVNVSVVYHVLFTKSLSSVLLSANTIDCAINVVWITIGAFCCFRLKLKIFNATFSRVNV